MTPAPLTAQEIIGVLPDNPEDGLTISQLAKWLRKRNGDVFDKAYNSKAFKSDLIDLVVAHGVYKRDSKTFSREHRPLVALPSTAQQIMNWYTRESRARVAAVSIMVSIVPFPGDPQSKRELYEYIKTYNIVEGERVLREKHT